MVACVVVLEVDPGSGIVGVESADAGAAVRFFISPDAWQTVPRKDW